MSLLQFLIEVDSFTGMFENYNFSKSLNEDTFDNWLQQGRDSKVGYKYLLITWDTMDEEYKPTYLINRQALVEAFNYVSNSEISLAAYDLFSESKININ